MADMISMAIIDRYCHESVIRLAPPSHKVVSLYTSTRKGKLKVANGSGDLDCYVTPHV